MMQVLQICRRYCCSLSPAQGETLDPCHRVPQVAWVGNLAQPLLAMHAWRSLWVIAKTTAACLRSPKLLLRNLR